MYFYAFERNFLLERNFLIVEAWVGECVKLFWARRREEKMFMLKNWQYFSRNNHLLPSLTVSLTELIFHALNWRREGSKLKILPWKYKKSRQASRFQLHRTKQANKTHWEIIGLGERGKLCGRIDFWFNFFWRRPLLSRTKNSRTGLTQSFIFCLLSFFLFLSFFFGFEAKWKIFLISLMHWTGEGDLLSVFVFYFQKSN